MDRMESARADSAEEGIQLAAELMTGVKGIDELAGVHLMGLGHPETVARAVELAGLLPRP